MNASIYKGKEKAARLPVVAALWMLIVVTLLSALMPLGPPSSAMAGSAFNPATSDVALKARAPHSPQTVKAARPDGSGDTLPILLLLPALAALLTVAGRICATCAHRPAIPRLHARPRHAPGQPRAPPARS